MRRPIDALVLQSASWREVEGRGSRRTNHSRESDLSCITLLSERDVVSAHLSSQRIVISRAVLALIWAAAVVVAIGDRVPTTDAEIPVAAGGLLAAYPLIDVVASLAGARRQPDAAALRVNATISALAAVGVGVT